MNPTTYRFKFDVYRPDTLPLARLADYLQELAGLFGYEHSAHFVRLESGSTHILSRIDPEDSPKVKRRIRDIRTGDAPPSALKFYNALNQKLAEDNAVGALIEETEDFEIIVIEFKGRESPKPERFGPINQVGSVDGVLVRIGGIDKTISLTLQAGNGTLGRIETDRELARQLGRHLFEPMRLFGMGRWVREVDGHWQLLRFRVDRFEPLKDRDLVEVIEALRTNRLGDWPKVEDPIEELIRLRSGSSEA